MNCSPREFSSVPPDSERRKTVLFCQTCGRAGSLGEWPTQMDGERVDHIDCPDCGTTVWQGLDSDGTDEPTRISAPTP